MCGNLQEVVLCCTCVDAFYESQVAYRAMREVHNLGTGDGGSFQEVKRCDPIEFAK